MRHVIAAAVLIMATPARGATISWVSALRRIDCGDSPLAPSAEFADFDGSLSGVLEQEGQNPRVAGTASQRSMLRADSLTVSSSISGDALRGTSLFMATFEIDEPVTYGLNGSLSLLGTVGFACVSLVNLAQTDLPLVHEVIFAPPRVSETRPLAFTGIIDPGRYSMEVMIYGGGDNQFTSGGIDVVFSIPEPRAASLVAGFLMLRLRRPAARHSAGRRRATRE